MDDAPRWRIEDLRRFATAVGAATGLPPAWASALAAHLLWYDAAGLPAHGLATLPDLLERMVSGAIDPRAEGAIVRERAATVVLDGRRGLPALILGRAAALAGEKARDVGLGLVQITGIGPTGPLAAVAAEVALGPEAAVVLGHDGSWAVALPSGGGLPLVFDSRLSEDAAGAPALPWQALVPREGWLVLAATIAAVESLSAFHERVAALSAGAEEAPGLLRPDAWEARRREARERGVPLSRTALDRLHSWSDRLKVPRLVCEKEA